MYSACVLCCAFSHARNRPAIRKLSIKTWPTVFGGINVQQDLKFRYDLVFVRKKPNLSLSWMAYLVSEICTHKISKILMTQSGPTLHLNIQFFFFFNLNVHIWQSKVRIKLRFAS